MCTMEMVSLSACHCFKSLVAKKVIDVFVFRLVSLLHCNVRDYCQYETKIVQLYVSHRRFLSPSLSPL